MTPSSSSLDEVLPGLYWYRDTCNVYVMKREGRALLIDFGSGGILDVLEEVGIDQVDWVLHTHHHRDQCQGDDVLEGRGIPIAVPAREAALFEDVDAFWRLRRIYDNYDVSSSSSALQAPVRVSHRLKDYETFTWLGQDITVLPTPGHTKGSVTFVARIAGQLVGFVGDLMGAPGRLHTIHDLQWQYGAPDGVGAALHSVGYIAEQGLDWALPSHGRPHRDPSGPLADLASRLDVLYRLQAEISQDHSWRSWPHVLDQEKVRVSQHLWANPHSVANSYAIVSDAGAAMLLDYGFPSWDHFYADQRFVEHSLRDFEAVAGIKSVDVVVPSHYHDDHLAGVPWLQSHRATQAWIFDAFADIVREPSRYNIPCLLETPIQVDRELADGQSFEWGGVRFHAFHMPGHTWWAGALFAEIDGTRIAYTGDNMFAGAVGPLRAGGPIYRNRMLSGSFALGVSRLMDFRPEILLTGHTGAVEVTRDTLEGFHRWARSLDDAYTRLVSVPDEVDFALDPNFVVISPYHTSTFPGAEWEIQVLVTNHGSEEVLALVTAAAPMGWTMLTDSGQSHAEASLAGKESSRFDFSIRVPSTARGRYVLCVDLTLGGRRWGQVAEAIVDVVQE